MAKGQERNSNGTFKKGNSLTRKSKGGRPTRKTEEKYLKAMIGKVPLTKWRQIADRAVQDAMGQDRTITVTVDVNGNELGRETTSQRIDVVNAARAWLSDHLMGKPVDRMEVEHHVPQEFEDVDPKDELHKQIEKLRSEYVIEGDFSVEIRDPKEIDSSVNGSSAKEL